MTERDRAKLRDSISKSGASTTILAPRLKASADTIDDLLAGAREFTPEIKRNFADGFNDPSWLPDINEERVTRRDLVEGKIGKVLDAERTGSVQVTSGLKFENAFQIAEAAKIMATCGPMLPPWLQGNVGGCWGILLRSNEIGVPPLTLAAMTFVTEKKGVQRLGYDSVYFRTMVEKFAPIKQRLQARYEGEGDDLVCIVFATFKGEATPREFPPPGQHQNFTLGKLRPDRNEYGRIKGSELWDTKPEIQLWYAMSRDWARMYCADIVAGAYTRDELDKEGFGATDVVAPSDMSPRLRDRLSGPRGEGFAGAAAIDKALAEATPKPPKEWKEVKKTVEAAPPGDDAVRASEVPGPGLPAGDPAP